jgi:hypothetical protein
MVYDFDMPLNFGTQWVKKVWTKSFSSRPCELFN